MVFTFLLLPVAVYMLIYLPWFHHFGWSMKAWWDNQVAIWDFHRDLLPTALDNKTHLMTPIHPYLSRPWGWLLIWRPVAYYYRTVGSKSLEVIAIGNQVIFWWALLWTIPHLIWASISRRKRDWIAVFILAAIATQYLPWFFISRAQFFFYMTPITPFLVLGLVYAIRDASHATVLLREPETGALYESTSHPYRWVAVAMGLLTMLAFAWFFPVLVASPLSHAWWKARIWFPGWV